MANDCTTNTTTTTTTADVVNTAVDAVELEFMIKNGFVYNAGSGASTRSIFPKNPRE